MVSLIEFYLLMVIVNFVIETFVLLVETFIDGWNYM
jgi:hypothetical protein